MNTSWIASLINLFNFFKGLFFSGYLTKFFNVVIGLFFSVKVYLPLVKDGYKNWSILLKVTKAISGIAEWVIGCFETKDYRQCHIKYGSTRIKAMITANPRCVSEWSRKLREEILKDGFPRAGTIIMFIPEVGNTEKFGNFLCPIIWCYLVVFVAPNNCMIYKIDGEVMIPAQFRTLLDVKDLVFYLESMHDFERLMHLKCDKGWEIPRNIVNLDILLQCCKYQMRGKDFVEMAECCLIRDSGFTYKVPEKVISSNWVNKGLDNNQIHYLVMRAYAGHLVATDKGWTNGSFLVDVFTSTLKVEDDDDMGTIMAKIKKYY